MKSTKYKKMATCFVGSFILYLFSINAVLLSFTSCASKPKVEKKVAAGDLDDKSNDPAAEQLRELFILNENGQGKQTLSAFRDFQKQNPNSIYFQAARFGEGWSLEQTDAFDEALKIYNSVMSVSKLQWPRLYSRSLYRSSFIYEALGEDVKLIAALMEARNLIEDLPPEVVYTEVPSRLSMIYVKINQTEEAQKYLREADQGLKRLLATQVVSNQWLAKMYFQMGSLKLSSMNSENLAYYVQSQRVAQRYLLSSLSLNDTVWSELALKKLTENYSTLWTLIESYKENDKSDSFDRVEARRQQFLVLGDYIKLVSEALQLKPLEEQRMNPYQNKAFDFFEAVEKKSYDFLYSKFDRMSLTEESLHLNDVKRPGKVIVNDLFPNER